MNLVPPVPEPASPAHAARIRWNRLVPYLEADRQSLRDRLTTAEARIADRDATIRELRAELRRMRVALMDADRQKGGA